MTERIGSAVSPPAGRLLEEVQLGALLDLAAGGVAQTILVAGSAGVGKTTLVTATTAGRGAIVATGTCLPLVSVTVPFMAIHAAMASVPVGADHPAVTDGAIDDVESAVVERFDRWLDVLCATAPVVLVIEDLHWADQFTLDTLMYVIAGPATRRVAVVLTMRHDEISDGHRLKRWLADVSRLPRFTELPLGPLDRLQTAEQLAGLLGEVPHQALVEDVFRRGGGNPLLTRLLATGLDPQARQVADTIPSNLRSAVLHSWFGLEPRARELVTILAIGSRPMHPAELAVVARDNAATVGEHLSSAVSAGVLETSRDGTFWFSHLLYAEVLEEAVAVDDRRRLHAAFADRLEAGDAEAAGVLAEHRFRAGELPDAYRWSLRAASWHEAEGAPAASIPLLRRAIALRQEVEATESEEDLLVWSRRAAASAGAHEDELKAVDALLRSTSPETRPGEVAELLVRRTQLHLSTGRGFYGQEDLREAVRLSAARPTSPEHALALAELGQGELWHGNEEGIEHARAALQIARAAGDDRALCFALAANAFAALVSGDAAAGLPLARQAFDAGLRSRDWWACTNAVFWEAKCSACWPSLEYATTLSWRREQLARAGAPRAYLAWLAAVEAFSLLAVGSWQDCAARLRETLAADPGVLPDVKTRLSSARLAVWQGRQREAEQHLARADELFAAHSEFLAFEFDAVRAEVRLGAGDAQGAHLAALAGLSVPGSPVTMCEWLVPLAARALADQAQAARDAGRSPSPVLSLVEELRTAYPRVVHEIGAVAPAYARQLSALDALYAAELGRAREDPDEGALWVLAADALESSGLAWECAYACRRGAEALLNRGRDRANGAALLRRGLDAAEPLAAGPLQGELHALALRARVSPRRVVATDAAATTDRIRVTPREREILALLVSGRTYAEIATELVISEKTVSSHVSNLLTKTGTSNRVELAGYADRSHLTTA